MGSTVFLHKFWVLLLICLWSNMYGCKLFRGCARLWLVASCQGVRVCMLGEAGGGKQMLFATVFISEGRKRSEESSTERIERGEGLALNRNRGLLFSVGYLLGIMFIVLMIVLLVLLIVR